MYKIGPFKYIFEGNLGLKAIDILHENSLDQNHTPFSTSFMLGPYVFKLKLLIFNEFGQIIVKSNMSKLIFCTKKAKSESIWMLFDAYNLTKPIIKCFKIFINNKININFEVKQLRIDLTKFSNFLRRLKQCLPTHYLIYLTLLKI